MRAEHPHGHLVVQEHDDEWESDAVTETEDEKPGEKTADLDLGGQEGVSFDVQNPKDGNAGDLTMHFTTHNSHCDLKYPRSLEGKKNLAVCKQESSKRAWKGYF